MAGSLKVPNYKRRFLNSLVKQHSDSDDSETGIEFGICAMRMNRGPASDPKSRSACMFIRYCFKVLTGLFIELPSNHYVQ